MQCQINHLVDNSPSEEDLKDKQNHINYLYKKEAEMREVSELAIITMIKNGMVL